MVNNYSKMTPSEIDNILVDTLTKKDGCEFTIDQAIKHLNAYENRMETYKELAENGYTAKVRKEYAPKVVELEGFIATTKENRSKAEASYNACIKEIVTINAEFDSRGGWNRYWLVDNTNGHIHHNRQCSSCFPTTVFAWLPDQSGMRSTDLVELAGEKACTVCFPDAPVSALNRPSLLEAPDRKKQRLEREAKKLERQRVLEAKAITNVAGGKLMIPGEHWAIKTLNEAGRILTSNLTDFLAVDAGYRVVHNPSYEAEKVEQNTFLIEAIAHKHGVSKEDVLSEYQGKAERKLKRDYKNFNKQ